MRLKGSNRGIMAILSRAILSVHDFCYDFCQEQIELSGFVAHELSALYRSERLRKSETEAAFLKER